MHERPLTSSYDPDTTTLAFAGAVDESSVETFRAEIAAAGLPLVIDLSEVDYFPSVAVSALIAATRDGAPEDHEFFAASGTVAQRVLQICGLPHRSA